MYEWYAVKRGRYPGVYGSWDEANEQIHGYSNNCWKGFDDWQQAEDFVNGGARTGEADNLANHALNYGGWEGLKDAEGNYWTYNDLCIHIQVASRYPESEEDDAFAW
ncbi:hypothetical protein CVIRNUC_006268 [Coccomyxa viridis]|uniref:Ribonuclease H n=1 Tax=Coccomyxa viridis TaxID=1274662 RepID=A0AAV1IB70_9CHLO|nr:hypothetical protein CVIRNUC_006268 [Coccomyxa viridis]